MTKIREPQLRYCTRRDAYDEHDIHSIHIECRFDDGQKFPAVIVDGEFETLAEKIENFLNNQKPRCYMKKGCYFKRN